MSATPRAVPNLVHNRSRGFWANGWNITIFCLFTPFFRELTYRSDPSTDFHAWWLKRRELAQGCAFLGFVDIAPHLGVKSPKTQILGREAFSSQTDDIEKHAYHQNYCVDSNQILHSDRDNQMPVVRTYAQQIQDGGRPLSWKNWKIAISIGNGLTDRHEIWHGDVVRPCWSVRWLTIWNFNTLVKTSLYNVPTYQNHYSFHWYSNNTDVYSNDVTNGPSQAGHTFCQCFKIREGKFITSLFNVLPVSGKWVPLELGSGGTGNVLSHPILTPVASCNRQRLKRHDLIELH